MTMQTQRPAIKRDGGFVLIVGLILLVVLSFLGVSVMQTANLEERMAGNTRDRAIAFNAAEASLLATWQQESKVTDPAAYEANKTAGRKAYSAEFNGVRTRDSKFYGDQSSKEYWFANPSYWKDANESMPAPITITGLATQPRVSIAEFKPSRGEREQGESQVGNQDVKRITYLVTARSVGHNGAEVVVQGTFSKIPEGSQLFNNPAPAPGP